MGSFIVLAVVGLLYYRSFRFKAIMDDITMMKFKTDWISHIKRMSFLPILRRFFYGACFQSLKANHAVSLVMFSIVCLLINMKFGTLVACVYAIHPINNQTAIWMNGRRYLASMIVMLAILNWTPAIILYPLIFHFHVISAPVILMVSPLFILAIPIILFFSRNSVTMRSFFSRINIIPDGEMMNLCWKKIILVVKSYGFYLAHGILPLRKFFYYSYLQNFGLNNKGNREAYRMDVVFWSSLVALGILIGLAVYFPVMRFGVIWWFVFTLPWTNVITPVQMFADRYASAASLFLIHAMVSGIALIPHPYGAIIILLLCLGYLLMTISIFPMYKDIMGFFTYHTYHSPQNVEACFYISKTLMNQKRFYEATYFINKGLKINPLSFKLNATMAECLVNIAPREAEGFIMMAEVNKELGKEDFCTDIINQLKEGLNAKRRRVVGEKIS